MVSADRAGKSTPPDAIADVPVEATGEVWQNPKSGLTREPRQQSRQVRRLHEVSEFGAIVLEPADNLSVPGSRVPPPVVMPTATPDVPVSRFGIDEVAAVGLGVVQREVAEAGEGAFRLGVLWHVEPLEHGLARSHCWPLPAPVRRGWG